MTKTCEYCTCAFETYRTSARYCSKECAGMAQRKAAFERHEAWLDAVANADPRHHHRIWIRRPKSYAEIRRANRKRKVQDGWRGRPVLGGGKIHRNDAWLEPCEIER